MFTGPMYKGAMRDHRRILREEALERQAAYRKSQKIKPEEEELAVYQARSDVLAAKAAVLSGKFTDRDAGLVMPLIPEFRESMRKAEHARAEGRTISADELLRRLGLNQVAP